MTFKNLIDKVKYGKIRKDIDLGRFHVAGPVDDTGKAIGAKYGLSGLIDPNLIEYDGQIFSSKFAKKKDYIEFVRKLGQAYLNGRFNFGSVVPINADYFILPIKPNILTNLIHKVKGLEEVSFSGKVKHPIDRGTLRDVPSILIDRLNKQENLEEKWEKAQVEQTPLEQAQQYLKDLLFWRLDFSDYSDIVRINVQERTQKEKTSGLIHGLRRNFIVSREWFKDPGGVWSPIKNDGERVVISGYQPRNK